MCAEVSNSDLQRVGKQCQVPRDIDDLFRDALGQVFVRVTQHDTARQRVNQFVTRVQHGGDVIRLCSALDD